MPKFSKASIERALTCDLRIRRILARLITLMDVTVLEGHREPELHAEYLRTGRSRNPHSLHLFSPALAVDVMPYPVAWPSVKIMQDKDAQAFARAAYMVGLARGIAAAAGTPLRSGLDWDSDGEIADTSWFDLAHLELATQAVEPAPIDHTDVST